MKAAASKGGTTSSVWRNTIDHPSCADASLAVLSSRVLYSDSHPPARAHPTDTTGTIIAMPCMRLCDILR